MFFKTETLDPQLYSFKVKGKIPEARKQIAGLTPYTVLSYILSGLDGKGNNYGVYLGRTKNKIDSWMLFIKRYEDPYLVDTRLYKPAIKKDITIYSIEDGYPRIEPYQFFGILIQVPLKFYKYITKHQRHQNVVDEYVYFDREIHRTKHTLLTHKDPRLRKLAKIYLKRKPIQRITESEKVQYELSKQYPTDGSSLDPTRTY